MVKLPLHGTEAYNLFLEKLESKLERKLNKRELKYLVNISMRSHSPKVFGAELRRVHAVDTKHTSNGLKKQRPRSSSKYHPARAK